MPSPTQHPAEPSTPQLRHTRGFTWPSSERRPATQKNPNSTQTPTPNYPNSLADTASGRVFRHHLQLARGWRAAGGCCGLRPSSGLPNGAETGSGHQTPTTTGHRAPWGPVATRPVPAAPQQPPATNLPALPMGPDDATPGSLREKFPPRRPAASRLTPASPSAGRIHLSRYKYRENVVLLVLFFF